MFLARPLKPLHSAEADQMEGLDSLAVGAYRLTSYLVASTIDSAADLHAVDAKVGCG